MATKADEVDPSKLQDLEGDTPEPARPHRRPPSTTENAFSILMTAGSNKAHSTSSTRPPKPRSKPSRHVTGSFQGPFIARYGLGIYLQPTYKDPSMISRDEHWCLIWDMYPKSKLHILLLPRHVPQSQTYVLDAFDDAAFRAACVAKIAEVRGLAGRELRRIVGGRSGTEQRRAAAIGAARGDDGRVEIPPARDYEVDVKTGVHAMPSMNHLHVHFLSVDRISEKIRCRAHYNSFNTGFLIPVEDFPLAADDPRRDGVEMGRVLRGELRCWRCHRCFKALPELKGHLEREFEEWAGI